MSPVPSPDIEATASTLRALSNPMRLRVVLRLLQGACSVATLELELGLRQPNLSQQLAELREAGLVVAERRSRSMVYHLADGDPRRVVEALAHGIGVADGARKLVPPRPTTRPREAAVFARVDAA